MAAPVSSSPQLKFVSTGRRVKLTKRGKVMSAPGQFKSRRKIDNLFFGLKKKKTKKKKNWGQCCMLHLHQDINVVWCTLTPQILSICSFSEQLSNSAACNTVPIETPRKSADDRCGSLQSFSSLSASLPVLSPLRVGYVQSNFTRGTFQTCSLRQRPDKFDTGRLLVSWLKEEQHTTLDHQWQGTASDGVLDLAGSVWMLKWLGCGWWLRTHITAALTATVNPLASVVFYPWEEHCSKVCLEQRRRTFKMPDFRCVVWCSWGVWTALILNCRALHIHSRTPNDTEIHTDEWNRQKNPFCLS